MEYSAVHNKLLVSPEEFSRFSKEIKYVMASIRKELNVPLGPRDRELGLSNIDHIERDILQACKVIGVDLGSEWGHTLDLSQFKG